MDIGGHIAQYAQCSPNIEKNDSRNKFWALNSQIFSISRVPQGIQQGTLKQSKIGRCFPLELVSMLDLLGPVRRCCLLGNAPTPGKDKPCGSWTLNNDTFFSDVPGLVAEN